MAALLRLAFGMLSKLVQTRAGQWLLAILATVGLQFATYSFAIEPWIEMVENSMTGMPADAAAWLGFAWIDRGVSIIVSAYVASMALGALKRVALVRKAT